MTLERYRQKRDFKATPEPRGEVSRSKASALQFVIQKHAASHLHYDFRLELNGVLLSWAVPKGPSLDPADKRLAMHVEDHPIEYGGFEGTIPAKQYGGGTVMLWDRGTWTPKGDAAADYAKGRLKFELDGEKLHGGWTLIRTHGSKYGGGDGKQAWLLIKENDEFVRRGADGHIVDERPDSVLSGRNMDAIANDQEHVWQSNRSAAANVKAGAVESASTESATPASPAKSKSRTRAGAAKAVPDDAQSAMSAAAPGDVKGAKKARLAAALSPELTTLVDTIPDGDEWLHEVKYDGYRMVCRVDKGKARVFSRNGKEWTHLLGPVVDAVARLPIQTAWLDGEVAVVGPDGQTSFQLLQNGLADPSVGALTYFVFDLPYLDGYDLRDAVLSERKRLLRAIIPETDPTLRYGLEVRGSGPEFFAQACKLNLEGAVSKRADSTYKEGVRNREWIKVKCGRRQEMVIGGFTDPQRSRTGLGALLLGVYEPDGKLRYSGRVGTGFDARTLGEMRLTLDKLACETTPFFNPPRGFQAKGVHWVTPKLVAEVAFTEWTADGTLRHPSFKGLRQDKKATDVIRERPVEEIASGASTKKTAAPASAKSKAVKMKSPAKEVNSAHAPAARGAVARPSESVAGVMLSHPEKLLFPEANLTKLDLARYYEAIGDWIVPHIKNRPLSLVRCPDGWSGQCFYQKHADKSVNPAVDRVTVPEGKGTSTYMSAGSTTAVVALLQWGVLEFHPWGSCTPKLDRPDRLIFDFDPDDGISWDEVVAAANLIRTLLGDLGLQGFLKTTGGKGLHVVVPIRPTLEWVQAKAFTKAIADLMVTTFPDRFIATLAKAQRQGKIFIDYLRNAEGATAIAPYSIRARANAPVSVPIAWEEMSKDVRFGYFNVATVTQRLADLKRDPWAEFLELRQSVTKTMMKKVGVKGA